MTPTVDHEADTRNFSDTFTRLPASNLAGVDDDDDDAVEHHQLFLGFSFSTPARTRGDSIGWS